MQIGGLNSQKQKGLKTGKRGRSSVFSLSVFQAFSPRY
jgi:hypothetical protein